MICNPYNRHGRRCPVLHRRRRAQPCTPSPQPLHNKLLCVVTGGGSTGLSPRLRDSVGVADARANAEQRGAMRWGDGFPAEINKNPLFVNKNFMARSRQI